MKSVHTPSGNDGVKNGALPVVGIPRALLYDRYGELWEHFFRALGIPVILSPVSNRGLLEKGIALAPDESCLSMKMYMGHVQALMGKCDWIFIPRYSNYGYNEIFCTRFEGLYDQVRNLYRSSSQRFLTCNIDAREGSPEPKAFEQLGVSLGFSKRESRKAWKEASAALEARKRELAQEQEARWAQPGLRVLVAGHSYILSDPYLGKPILDYLEAAGAVSLRTDLVDPEKARKACAAFSPTCRWIVSEEIVGGILLRKEEADGIILVSTFPCGPDSMTNELLVRKVKGIPILTLILDTQSGTAGMETRLESFLDILQFQKNAGGSRPARKAAPEGNDAGEAKEGKV